MTRQSQFLTVTSCEEAHRLFQSHLDLRPLGSEVIPINQSLGRILSVPVIAKHNVPGFDRSNFDGFAIQSADTAGASETNSIILELLDGKIPAGCEPTESIKKGQAISISTGGMIPRGANAVCLVEHTQIPKDADDDGSREKVKTVAITRSSYAGSGISFAGSDIAQGETVLRAGQTITSRETGALAAIGETEVEVFRKPKVAVISTGNEIIPPGDPIRPGQVFDSNARIIADAVTECGGESIEFGIAVDDLTELESRVEQALATADIVLLSGGTSKGEGDLSYKVVSRYRDPGIVAHGVSLKPGKPICLAVTQGKPLVVLPGFPTSAIFTFHEFIAPLIASYSGQGEKNRDDTITARLALRVNSEIGRTEFLLVGLLSGDAKSGSKDQQDQKNPEGANLEGQQLVQAYPMGKGSGSVTTFSRADGFITIDRQTELVEQGENVTVQLIGRHTQPADLVVMGSHCQKLDLILNELQSEGTQIKTFTIGSTAGLNAAIQGDCDVAGIHLYDPETETYNEPFATPEITIVKGYTRTQGLVYRKSDRQVDELSNLPVQELLAQLAGPLGLMMVNRNQGSGTRILIDRLLDSMDFSQPEGYEIQVANHHAVCAAVKQHRADWGIAIEPVANGHGLGFIPIENERFDFAIPRSRLESKSVQAFLQKLQNI